MNNFYQALTQDSEDQSLEVQLSTGLDKLNVFTVTVEGEEIGEIQEVEGFWCFQNRSFRTMKETILELYKRYATLEMSEPECEELPF